MKGKSANKLDIRSKRPRYQQLKEEIKAKIENQEYRYGDKIPSEQEIIAEYEVSRITVRRAIEELCIEGYLVKKQGKGTFVDKPKLHRKIDNVESFSEGCRNNGMVPSHRLLERVLVDAGIDEQKFFGLRPGDKVIYTQRVLCADGDPIQLENCYYPFTEKYHFMLEEPLDGSLFTLLRQHGMEPCSNADNSLELVLASDKVASLLQVPSGEPLFSMISYLSDADGEPLYLERNYIVGSRYKFIVP